ncbi:MAG: S8 family serine peptidase [Pseudomonadota bacterium]|nr:S8 family serine peptidase [Pseudomonadota bacterium]
MLKTFMAVGLSLCVGLASYPVSAADPDPRASTRQLIVRLKDDGLRRIQAVRRNDTVPDIRLPDGRPLSFIRRFNGNGMVVRLPADVSLEEAQRIAEQLAENPAVASAQPDKRMYPALVPDDKFYLPGTVPFLAGQWHLFEPIAGIRMQSGWDRETGSSSMVIGQLDTGIIPHRDLDPARILAGFDFITDVATANDGDGRDPDPTDPGDWADVGDPCYDPDDLTVNNSSWHGLAVAGVMVAESDNLIDIAGIDFAARLLPVRVLGKCGGAVSDVIDAIRWAAGLPVAGIPDIPDNPTPADVINLSLSGVGSCSFEEQAAINDAVNAGAVVVVAAGNEATDVATISPASCDNVVTVAAVGRDGSRASYMNAGEEVDLSGPGGDGDGAFADGILTLFNSGTTVPAADRLAEIQGTSFTTAQTSAVVSLMWAASRGANVALDPGMIQEILRRTTRAFPNSSCNTSTCGTGILDADAALAAAVDPASVLGSSVNTGDGGSGCVLIAKGSSRFDPVFMLLLVAAGLRCCRRCSKSGLPE